MAASGVSIDITGCMTALDAEGREFVVFAIYICLGPYAWTVYRRYSEFRALEDLLRRTIADLAACPAKHPAPGGTLTRDVMEIRRRALLHWIRNLARDERVCCSAVFHNFLRQNANKPPQDVQLAARAGPTSEEAGAAAAAAASAGAAAAGADDDDDADMDAAAPGGAGAAAAGAPPRVPDGPHRGLDAALSARLKVSLADFSLVKVIGKGSFGKVFLTRKLDSGRVYAMKVLHKRTVAARKQVEHTVTERAVMGKISHPFIVGLKYAFQTADKLYFVMDYCPGGELFFHLGKEGRFHEGRAKFYAAQILLALEHLHSKGVVYRDLKPENVLLDAKGNIKLTDFGLSKEGVTQADTGAHSFCGTPEYLAPEILARSGHGRAVDWWSLGALLFEMLTGWPPFYSSDRKELFAKIREAKLDLSDTSNLTPAAVDILKRLLNKDPRSRLGCLTSDASDIKSHPFFAGVDWAALARREIPPPWTPGVRGSDDTSFFSPEFTRLDIASVGVAPGTSAAAPGQLASASGDWGGFSFVARDSSVVERAGLAAGLPAAVAAAGRAAALAAAALSAGSAVGSSELASLASSSSSSSSSSATGNAAAGAAGTFVESGSSSVATAATVSAREHRIPAGFQ
ncbi:hypothetical protein FNF29_04088 [Cafeteria roenbergensis]|uniref:non-specific serine/threonine protein kinase n=1 Tax=Cafeteria roenbergensis TaxID=33653 RepID=A0A5A8CIA9_CAFRO|nr:hypothetical protein FNF29_04088 [Cafeteria roenbergensis]|eukprot:KAA0152224.1 hypothetical protein FNF29_04088 [Cafeteria roenbergensis]